VHPCDVTCAPAWLDDVIVTGEVVIVTGEVVIVTGEVVIVTGEVVGDRGLAHGGDDDARVDHVQRLSTINAASQKQHNLAV